MIEIHSNFKAYDRLLANRNDIRHTFIGEDVSILGSVRVCWRAGRKADFLILNLDHRRLFIACILFLVAVPRPLRRCRLVSVDILLRPPKSSKQRIIARVKGLLLRQVELFLLYFKNVDGYVREFHLSRRRIAYVPFKVNSWQQLKAKREAGLPDGDYVLLAGETLRDRATFVQALRETGLPGLLVLPPSARSKVEHHDWFVSPPPANVRIEFHSDGKESTYLGYFERTKLVCLPRYRWDIASTGISACYCAMALGKCVVISKGPGAEDLFEHGEALLFESEDAASLAQALIRGWQQADLRARTAQAGASFTDELEGEEKLLVNILRALESQ